MRTIIHVSDIHFGRTDPASIAELVPTFAKIDPDLVVISGDLTQRAETGEFEDAKKFLNSLRKAGLRYLVIPGNHDIQPLYKPLSRIFSPYGRFKKYVSPILSPTYVDRQIAVASINTVRTSSIKDGSVNIDDIEKVAAWFSKMPENVIKVVVSHHPFDLPGTIHKRKLAKRAQKAVYRLAEDKIDIYLSGHYHQSSSVPTIDRYADNQYSAIAIQAGTVSLRQREEVQSFNVICIEKPKITVDTYLWNTGMTTFTNGHTSKKFIFRDNQWQAA